MTRSLVLAAAQLGPIQKAEGRDVVIGRIVRLMGDVPRIELFARSRAPGWDVWGNEAVGSIQGWPPQENLQEVS